MKNSLSLRSKFALALTLSCIVSILIVGIVADKLGEEQFKNIADERVFAVFSSDITGYYEKYQFDPDAEVTLFEWMSKKEQERFSPSASQEMDIGRRPDDRSQPPSNANDQFRGPPPPQTEGQPYQQAGGPPPQPPGGYQQAGGPPPQPPGGNQRQRTAVIDPYILITKDNKVLLGAGIYEHGSTLSEDNINNPWPINFQGETIAYAFPASTVTLNEQEKNYLSALRHSLVLGAIPAITLAFLLSIVISSYFGKRLNRLSAALKQLGEGDFQNNVQLDHENESDDELGELAKTFNKMADRLALSNEKIVAQAKKLSELSNRDELTGLHNRRYANSQASDHIARGARYGRPLSIAMCDLDNFKIINDTYLHEVGDKVLIEVGKIITSNLREVDITARYGGEEFVIIFPETTHEKAAMLAERLRLAITQFDWNTIAEGLVVTMSIGISSNDSLDKFESILAIADKNLYEAKNSGKNKVIA
jgi:diguanylate cyclase (GGDEF)-like protein